MEIMEYIKEFIRPELFILIPAVYFIGMALKNAEFVNDRFIPLILGGISVILSVIYVFAVNDMANLKDVLMAVFTAITQGVLCAGASVYVNQIIKQSSKK